MAGTQNRMEGTVISDGVSPACRIESLTQYDGSQMALSTLQEKVLQGDPGAETGLKTLTGHHGQSRMQKNLGQPCNGPY